MQIMKTLETHGDARERTMHGPHRMPMDEESGIAMNGVKIEQLPYGPEEAIDESLKESSERSVKYYGQ